MAESAPPPATSPPPASTSATVKATTESAEQQSNPPPATTTKPAAEEPVAESEKQHSVSVTADTEPATGEPVPETTGQQPTSSTDAGSHTAKMPVQSPQDAIRHPKFRPGVRQAFFSTGLGARAPRELGPIRMPVLARSSSGPEAVVAAAKYWMTKYKDQCLCILPNQGWVVEDLWDAEDIHMEGKRFCEEMLNYISRSSYWAAKQFADDWAKAHPGRVDFGGALPLGSVYDLNDPLPVVDQIFIFNELVDFHRPFLWHVAFLLISTWHALSSVSHDHFDVNLGQQIWDPPGGKAAEPVQTATEADRKPHSSSAADAKVPIREPPAPVMPPAQSNMRSGSHRAMPQIAPQAAGHHIPLRGGDMGAMVGHSMLSPSMHPQALNVPKGNRNMGSASYNQPHGWVDNRVGSGSYSRQASGSSMHSPQFIPAAMAVPQPMPMVPGPPMLQYAQGPPMLPVHGYPVQHYQPGPMQTPPMAPAYLHQPHGPHAIGDMTNNMHYPNNMGVQYADPRAPMPRRTSYQNPNVLYDPYNGTNPNFRKTSGYNGGGKKGGSGTFAVQPGQGRKMSGGRGPYNNSNTEHAVNVPTNGGRYNDFNYQKRFQEDDLSITGNSLAGCAHTWIGAENSTVTELWIGNLPLDVREDEIILLFQQNVGVTPITVSIRNTAANKPCHAFATFASSPEVKKALKIREHKPYMRNGTYEPSVTVPKRFFQKDTSITQQKDSSSSAHFAQSHAGQSEDRNTRGVTRMSAHDEESAIVDDDADTAAAGSNAQYSPQDARSGLSKKGVHKSESTDAAQTAAQTASPKPDKSKKSPTKKGKAKAKSGSPVDKVNPAEEAAKVATKLEVEDSVPVDAATAAEDAQASKEAIATLPGEGLQGPVSAQVTETGEPAKAVTSDAAAETEQPAASTVSDACEAIQAPISADTSTDLPDPIETSETAHDEEKSLTKSGPANAASKDPSPPPADDNVSDDEAKNDVSFHSAQEVQTPQPEVRDEPLVAQQGTTTPPVPLAETCSHFADTSQVPVSGAEPKVIRSQVPLTKPEASKAEETSQDIPVDKTATVQDAAGGPTDLTATSSASGDVLIATPTEASRVEAAKKNDAQVQSLHPFAKKQASQTKKESEVRKKQQKKEKREAERIAKVKAEQREKEEADRKAQAPKLAVPGTPAATGVPATANQANAGQATPGTKKSKAKTKMPAANTADQEKKDDGGDDTGKQPTGGIDTVSKETDSVTQKVDVAEISKIQPMDQASSTKSGTTYPEAIASPLPTGPAVALPKKAPTQEVNPHHKHLSQNILTHAHGSQGTPEIGSHQSSLPQSSVAPVHPPPQPVLSFPSSHSLGLSSSEILVPGDDNARVDVSTAFPPNTATPGPAKTDTVDAGASQPDATQTGTPTKKKKNKHKKKKAAAAETEATGSADNAPNPDPNDDIDEDDPWASQLSQIDDVRRALELEKKAAAESPKAPVKTPDPKAAEKLAAIKAFMEERFATIDKQSEEDTKNGVPPPIDEWNKNLLAYWDENPDHKPKCDPRKTLWSKKDFPTLLPEGSE